MKNLFKQFLHFIATPLAVSFGRQKQIQNPMTLCIAWKNNKGDVEFWSDSRLNFGDNTKIDMAVKVISFPLTSSHD